MINVIFEDAIDLYFAMSRNPTSTSQERDHGQNRSRRISSAAIV